MHDMARTVMMIMKVKTVSKVTGAEESRAEETAQPSSLTRVSQLLSPPCQSASSQTCPHDLTPKRRLVRTCARKCCRLL